MGEFNFTELYFNKDVWLNENKHIILEAHLHINQRKILIQG